ncbi:MAG TPA: TonB-dependent receptor [Thermoanaerobaculia bacterium]|nr:TonB-dependent receptor [Thermoanaerobaculia bacterium]
MQKHGRILFLLFLFALPVAAQTASIRGRVTLPDGEPLPGVTVTADESGVTTITNAEGNYVLEIPAARARGPVKVTVSLSGFQNRSETVNTSGGDATQNFTVRPSFGEQMTVGSRAIGAEQEKAVPVDVIPQAQIQSSPSTETNQIIQKIAPSFNFPRPTISDGTDSVRPATLRGLGPDQLLVMVNGRRRHASALVNANNTVGRGSSGVDLNAIPASAIDNVEILRDGAAAQYGSDAIAGVINLVLKRDAQPLRIDTKVGETTHSDGELLDTSINGGWGLGRGVLFLTGEYRVRYDTNRASPDLRDQIVAGDAGHNDVKQPNTHWGDSYARDLMSFANFNLPITPDGKQIFYAFGGYSLRHGSAGGNYRRALQVQNWPQIYPLGFLPLIQPRVADTSFTTGVRGEVASWFYDLSGGYGRNKLDFFVTHSLNTSLGPTLPPNQTHFYSGSLGDDQLTSNLDLSRPFKMGWMAGPLNVAVGAEYRRDGFQQTAGEPNSYINGGVRNRNGGIAASGAQVFPGFQPSNEVDVSRDSKAVYADLEGDVLSRLRIGLAGRYENFSDFGSTTNGKLTVRFAPVEHLIFRGSASTGFRAPSLSQGNFSAISTNFILNTTTGIVEPFETGTYRVNSPLARALGAQDLKPEKAKNLSGGVVWQAMSNLELTADYFHIDIDKRIVFSGNFQGPQILPLISPFGATAARFFTNAIDTRTNGYDLVANYNHALMGGRIDLSSAYSNNKTKIVGEVATPSQLTGLGNVLFDRIERRRVECGQPRDNIRLMQSLNRSGFTTTLRESRYGEYCSFTILPIDDQTYGAEWLADAELAYHLNHYTLAVGAENIFDKFPDRNLVRNSKGAFTAQINNGVATYPINTPFGMNGRFVYTRIGYSF